MSDTTGIATKRAEYSKMRLGNLADRLQPLPQANAYPALTIFAAGSYGRLEASEYSDIDLFFVTLGEEADIEEPRTCELRLFGKLVELIDELRFPKFSNDCQYLSILHSNDIIRHLGGRKDDHENYFTARMLMLLESRCLFNDDAYDRILQHIVASYFKDYPDHRQSFQPIFLLNDICRFWKTLLLNYEHKRPSRPPVADHDTGTLLTNSDEDDDSKIRQKVRNFKLKHSRMTTCFASVAALGSHSTPVTEQQVLEIVRLTPRERLLSVVDRLPTLEEPVQEVLDQYNWFLEKTGLPTEDLHAFFEDKQSREDMFNQARRYGDSMFEILKLIDAENPNSKLFRYLVI